MNNILSTFTVADWIFFGAFALVIIIMAFGVYSIWREIRAVARIRAGPVRLKTTEEQRRHWRQTSQSRDLLNLLDDIDTLLRHTRTDEMESPPEHREK